MKSSAVALWLSLLVLLGGAYGAYHVRNASLTPGSATIGEDTDSPKKPKQIGRHVEPFQLTDSQGEVFDSATLKGEVWLTSFFFSTCPGSCWQLNQNLKSIQDDPNLAGLTVVSITCDPETDSPEVLAAYAKKLAANHETWKFCTGEFRDIERIGKEQMLATVKRKTHGDSAILIDRSGKIRGTYNVNDPTQLVRLKLEAVDCLADPRPETAEAEGPDEPAEPAIDAPAVTPAESDARAETPSQPAADQ